MGDESMALACDSDISAKIRRLKIQESVLLQNLKCFPRVNQIDGVNIGIVSLKNDSEYKKVLIKTNDSYIYIKNLFDEVKANTRSQEILKSIEIENIKTKILELETNIISLKKNLGTELASLKLAEQELTKQLNENLNVIEKIKKQPKSKNISYNKIVPSPVKIIMNSPFKCSEVQQFQEFMSSSHNRYGSWNEYNHNIFVKYWQKHFPEKVSTDLAETVTNIERSEVYYLFLGELLCKLQGITKEDIVQHIKWYIKYIHLKELQQNALNNWKTNKKNITQANKNVKNHNKTIKNYENVDFSKDLKDKQTLNQAQPFSNYNKTSLEDILLRKHTHRTTLNPNHLKEKITIRDCEVIMDTKLNNLSYTNATGEQQNGPRFLKSTKQWIRRSAKNKTNIHNTYDIEKIEKLRTPGWRLGLQEYI